MKKTMTKRTDPVIIILAENQVIRELAPFDKNTREKLLGMVKDHVYGSSANNDQTVEALNILENADGALSIQNIDQLTTLKTIAAILASATGIKFGGQA